MKLGKIFKTTMRCGFFTKYTVKLWNSLSLKTKGLHGLKRDLDMFMERTSNGSNYRETPSLVQKLTAVQKDRGSERT